jgi:cysteine synthase
VSGLHVSHEKHAYDNILGAIGQTPPVRLGRVAASVQVPIYAKLENLNPGITTQI